MILHTTGRAGNGRPFRHAVMVSGDGGTTNLVVAQQPGGAAPPQGPCGYATSPANPRSLISGGGLHPGTPGRFSFSLTPRNGDPKGWHG